ncbi:MAG: PAS domain S-box protein [Pseudomonadota bacterium]
MLEWRSGLRFRLALLVLMACVPVLGLFIYSAAKNNSIALALAKTSLQSEALLAADRQQHLVDRVYQLLNDMTGTPSIQDTSTGLCVSYLKNLQARNGSYTNLAVVALDGKLACHALESELGKGPKIYVGDRVYFKQIVAGQKFAVGEFAVGRASGKPGLSFAVAVYGPDKKINGVAFATLDITAIAQALADGPVLEGAQLRVLDRQGTIMAVYPADTALQGKPESDAAVLALLQKTQSGVPDVVEATDPSGVMRVYAYAPVDGVEKGGMRVVISAPQASLTAGPREALYVSLLALLGMAAVGVGGAWWLGSWLIVKPTLAILKSAQDITWGDLGGRVRLGPWHQDEFGAIGASFNRMAASLQLRGQEVNAALAHVDEERALLNMIVNSMSEGVVAANTEGRLMLCNPAASRLCSIDGINNTLDVWHRKHELLTLDGKYTYPLSERPLSLAIRGVSTDNCEVLFRQPGAEDRIFRLSASPVRDKDRQLLGGVLVFNDMTELKAAEGFVRGQKEVLAQIASGVPLAQSLGAIVHLIERHAPTSLCSILLVKDGLLRHGAAPGLPESFVQAIDGLPIGEGVGACGTAAFRKEAVIVEEVSTDPLMQSYRSLLHEHDLQACWSVPVLSVAGEVMATFAVYRRTPCKPQPNDLELLDSAVRLARITLERSRAEAAVLESQARFREMAENIQDVFYNVEASTGKVLYISPGYEKIWGLSSESLHADPRSYADPVFDEDLPIIRRAWALNRQGLKSEGLYRILTPDGQTRWIRDNAYPVFGPDGCLERVVGTARDVTASKLADFALLNTHRALQMLSRSSIAINRIDDENQLLAAVCRVAIDVGGYRMAWVGYARDDEQRSIEPIAHAGHDLGYLSSSRVTWHESRRSGQGPAGQTVRSGQAVQSSDISDASSQFVWREAALMRGYRSVICLPLKDGQGVFGLFCMYSGEVQRFPDDEVQLLQELADNLAFGIVSLRARLERRRSQAAAREAAAKLSEQASLLDRAQDAIMVRNLDRTIRYWNKGAERLYGWTADEVLGKTMEQFMYRSPNVLETAMNKTLDTGGDRTSELEQVARDGSSVWVEARWTVVRDDLGQINGVLGINTDIRERRRGREEILQLNASLEERVQQRTAQLEFANKQLEAFSYSVSHDLRSPLSAIDGFSNLLENAIGKPANAKSVERSLHYLARIRAGVTHMGELIDAMLALAQVSRTNLRWEPVDLSTMAQELLTNYQERQPDQPVQCHVHPGMSAHGDPRLLKQVLDNLFGNAWKFSAGQACIHITFGQYIAQEGDSGRADPGEVVYFVRDQGAGFDMAYSEKLFGAFQRLHGPSEFAGTGIGLTTVHRIISRHGGQVWGHSVPGQGATFYFTLGAAEL